MARERVQTPDTVVDTPALRPGGIPDSTFVTPAQDPLLRLSSSLGELKPALQGFGDAYLETQHKQQILEQEKAKSDALITTPTQLGERVKKLGPAPVGSLPPTSTSIIQSKVFGQKVGQDLWQTVSQELPTVDWNTTDVDQYLAQHMQKAVADNFPNNGYAQIGFTDSVAGMREKILEFRTNQVKVADLQTRHDNSFSGISQTLKQADLDGASPTQKAAAVWDTVNALKGSQHLDFPTLNKMVMDIAARQAVEGKGVDAITLLNTPRKREDGTELPPLSETDAHNSEVTRIAHTVRTETLKQANLQAKQDILNVYSNMIATQAGQLGNVRDITITKEDGTPEVIGKDKIIKDSMRNYVDVVSPKIAQASHESKPQTFARELNDAAYSGVAHPGWEAILKSAPPGLANLTTLQDPSKLNDLLGAVALYNNIREIKPAYLNTVVPDSKTRQFYENFRVAQEVPGRDLKEAADIARRVSFDESPVREDILKGHYRTIEQTVLSADPRSFFAKYLPNWLGGSSAPINNGYVQEKIIQQARQNVALGFGPEDAIKRASEIVRQTSQVINGWVVPNIPGLPGDFSKKITVQMEDIANKYGKMNNDVGKNDIGLVYDGHGTFTPVGADGWGLRNPNGVIHFTLRDLDKTAAEHEDTLRTNLLDAAKQRALKSIISTPDALLTLPQLEEKRRLTAGQHSLVVGAAKSLSDSLEAEAKRREGAGAPGGLSTDGTVGGPTLNLGQALSDVASSIWGSIKSTTEEYNAGKKERRIIRNGN